MSLWRGVFLAFLCILIKVIGYNPVNLSLQENQTLPSANIFAECQKSCTRQRHSLPSARANTRQRILCRVPGARQIYTLGKYVICRVSSTRRIQALGKVLTGQTAPMAVIFAERAPSGTRQTALLCRVPHGQALGKGVFAECRPGHSAN